MKKAIALTLALAMAASMSAVALAGDDPIAENTYAPGSQISISADAFTSSEGSNPTEDLTRSNYTISADWNKGGAMVNTVKIDNDDKEVQINLKENYTIDEAKDLEGTLSLKSRGSDKTVYTLKLSGETKLMVTNLVVDVEGVKDADDAEKYSADVDNTIYQNDEDTPGYVKFTSGSEMLTVLANMAKNEKLFMHISEEEIEAIAEKYNKDGAASLYFFDFEGTPSLKNKATLSVEADYFKEAFVYEYDGSKLREVNAKLNSDEDAYEWTASKLTTIVVSDTKLKADGVVSESGTTGTDDKADTNPDTGANDIVGTAAALAVVSLIAAGAVALKKQGK